MRLGVDGFKIKGIIYLTSSPTPQCRLGCLLICGKCRAAFRRVACCASALSSYRSTITRLPSGTSPSQLHAIFAPSALFPGISRRCTGRCVRLRLRSSRYRRIRFNRECHPSWHLRQLATRRYASHRNLSASAQAVCHPLSGGSVACLVCASPHFTQATAPHARSLPYSTEQQEP